MLNISFQIIKFVIVSAGLQNSYVYASVEISVRSKLTVLEFTT